MMTANFSEVREILSSAIGQKIKKIFIYTINENRENSILEVGIIRLLLYNGRELRFQCLTRNWDITSIHVGIISDVNIDDVSHPLIDNFKNTEIISFKIIDEFASRSVGGINSIFGILIYFKNNCSLNIYNYEIENSVIKNNYHCYEFIYKNIGFITRDSLCIISNNDIIDTIKFNKNLK